VDGVEDHQNWIKDINETRIQKFSFLLLLIKTKISELYDFIHPNASATATVRSLLIIDPEKK
jgi:alkyl hydroperoxide reductase subunit AhpC